MGDAHEPSSRAVERLNDLFRAGRYEEALEGYRALTLTPAGGPMHANAGYACQALGRHLEAIEHFEAYLEELPFRHHAWKALAYSSYEVRDYERMTRAAREAIRWDIEKSTPDDYPWQQMATAHFLMGDLSTSLKAARKALQLNPSNAFARYYEACVLYRVASGAPIEDPTLLPGGATEGDAAYALSVALTLRPALRADVEEEGHLSALLSHPALLPLLPPAAPASTEDP
jgi:tetratricopeptide (TPR) repeat protein